jgi:hypothetical protein
LNSQPIFHHSQYPVSIDEYKHLTYRRFKELIKSKLLSDDKIYENPRFRIILLQCLAMYDSSCHAKFALHIAVFRDSIRRLGTQRHAYLIDLIENERVKEICLLLISFFCSWMFCFN